MKKYFFIGLGGFLGAILRFLVKSAPINNFGNNIPVNTLIINITGSFLLAFITTAALEGFKINTDLKLGICTGFLGAYTTFSTLCKESSELIYKAHYFYSITYVLNSAFLGLTAAYLGVVAGRIAATKLLNRTIENLGEN
ncbi:fluoride efflux transporter CrcB [Clostridium sp. P21]|uniref:Fluoride-specific ion channel FluC n=1 Tax=Clostridium muellerianum TaxID=2716538 RepID=A0A7Y0HNM1_9CLOT|nr:fluoride efflux transporter CrcB [Clostridium muellerianum]NMM62807.1 fluoride efflux transporter CrcB [Clostridium muellerianum]